MKGLPFEDDIGRNGVKGCREVEENEDADFSRVCGDKSISNFDEDRLCAVVCSVG